MIRIRIYTTSGYVQSDSKHMNSLVLLCLLSRYKLDDCALFIAMVVWLSGTTTHAIDLHIHTLVAIL